MSLVHNREPLAWALIETQQKLRELHPDRDEAAIRDLAASELLAALCCRDVTARGLHYRRNRKKRLLGRRGLAQIPMEFWLNFDTAGAFVAGIESGVFDPWLEGEEGSVYSAASVLPAELRAWLDRPGETTAVQTPFAKPHPGGRPPKFDYHTIWALTARDLLEHDRPTTIAELVRRIQAVCRENGLEEPDEKTLEPLARQWFDIIWRGQRPDPSTGPRPRPSAAKVDRGSSFKGFWGVTELPRRDPLLRNSRPHA
jgi:hypothetical protein